ncbi:MAG: DUF3971 domain-containing protein, partial [Geminicoccaceae bacterium]
MTRRLAHTLLRSVAWLVAVLVLLTAALGWRLLSAPLSLAWLTPAIERALTPADGDFHVEIERTELRRGADRLIELIGYEVRGQAPDGRVLFALPEIELNLSLSALVLHGVVAPERIHAIAPSLGLVRRADGSIGLRVSKDEKAAALQVTPKVLIGPFMSSDPDDPLAYLDSLNISGGRLVIYDEARGRSLMARNAEFVLERGPAGVNAAVSFEIGQPQGPARIAVTGIYRRGSDHIGFIADVKRLSILPLAAFAPEIPLAGIDLTLDGRLTGALSLDGALSTVGFEVSAEDGRIERPDVLSRALPVDTLEVKGATQRDLKEVVIDSFEVTSSGTSLEGSGRLVRSAAGAGLSAELRAENVPAADLDLYWPPELGEKARKWVLENITAGIAPHAEATLEFAPGELEERPVPEASVHGRFAFHNLTVGYFKTLPPLEGVDGSATFTARRMDIDVARAHVGNLEVSKGSAVITGMGIKGRDTTQLEVVADVAGPIQEALALIDHEPLGFASKIGIEPQATAGRTEVDLRIG